MRNVRVAPRQDKLAEEHAKGDIDLEVGEVHPIEPHTAAIVFRKDGYKLYHII